MKQKREDNYNMNNLPTYENFINEKKSIDESKSYSDLESDLLSTLEKTGIQKKCYDNEINISASRWQIPNPNGSISVTFWLMDDNININLLNKTAKEWADKNDLIVSSHKKGVEKNADPVKNQNWSNKAAMNSKFVYSLIFYSENYSSKTKYPPL